MNQIWWVFKVGRLRWLEQVFRMQEQGPYRKLTLHKPEGTRRVGRPATRWLDSSEEDLTTTGVRGLSRKSRDRNQWRVFVKKGQGSSPKLKSLCLIN
jgi:hypothetical protein